MYTCTSNVLVCTRVGLLSISRKVWKHVTNFTLLTKHFFTVLLENFSWPGTIEFHSKEFQFATKEWTKKKKIYIRIILKYCLFQTIRFHRKARRERERERVSLRSRLHISNICRNIYVNVTIEFERPSMLNRDWKIRATTAAYIRNPLPQFHLRLTYFLDFFLLQSTV